MRKTVFAALLILLLVAAGTASAVEPKARTVYVTLSACEDGSEMPRDAVMWQRVGSKYYFFLPGTGTLENARLWYGSGDAAINGKTIRSGDRIPDLKDGEAIRLRYMGKTYLVNVMQGSRIGAVFIDTDSGDMKKIDASKNYRESGSMFLLNEDGSVGYDGALDHIKLRGHTSAKFDKKGYAIKLHQKASLLGMGKAKRWALTSNARDHALIRNQICFGMAAYVEMPYTPQCRQVDLYLNHLYNGTYILQEKPEIGENRIDIADLEKATEAVNDLSLEEYPKAGSASATRGQFKYIDIPNDPEDITGGYLVEFEVSRDRYAEADCVYTTAQGRLIVVQEPEYASQAQMQYITKIMQGYENAIFAEDGIDPVSGKWYDEFIDHNSLVMKYMLEEISKNLDGNKSSQYFYKPENAVSTLAFAGPAWDYDSTFGDYGREKDSWDLLDPTGFYQGVVNNNLVASSYFWWPKLYVKPDFFESVCAIWQTRYAPALRVVLGREKDETGKLKSIEEYAAAIEKSAAMNFILWPMRQSSENIARCGKTFKANIEYLTNFISKRYDFLESEWGIKTEEPSEEPTEPPAEESPAEDTEPSAE